MVWFGFIWNFGDLDDDTGDGVSGGVGGGVLAVSASLLFEPVLPLIVVRSFFVVRSQSIYMSSLLLSLSPCPSSTQTLLAYLSNVIENMLNV